MTQHAELVAFYGLTQAKAKRCRTLDTEDWNGLAALMIDDIEFGMSGGEPEPQMTVGRNETLALLKSLVAGARTAHQVHAPEIDLNEHEAQVIWAVQDRAVGYARPTHGSSHRLDLRLECAAALASAATKSRHRAGSGTHRAGQLPRTDIRRPGRCHSERLQHSRCPELRSIRF